MAGEAISLRMEPTIVIFLNGHIIKLLLVLRVSQLCLEKLFFEQALAGNSRSWTVEGHRTCPRTIVGRLVCSISTIASQGLGVDWVRMDSLGGFHLPLAQEATPCLALLIELWALM